MPRHCCITVLLTIFLTGLLGCKEAMPPSAPQIPTAAPASRIDPLVGDCVAAGTKRLGATGSIALQSPVFDARKLKWTKRRFEATFIAITSEERHAKESFEKLVPSPMVQRIIGHATAHDLNPTARTWLERLEKDFAAQHAPLNWSFHDAFGQSAPISIVMRRSGDRFITSFSPAHIPVPASLAPFWNQLSTTQLPLLEPIPLVRFLLSINPPSGSISFDALAIEFGIDASPEPFCVPCQNMDVVTSQTPASPATPPTVLY